MKITSKHTKAAMHLIDGCSVAETARLVGVSSRSVFRWLEEPAFVLMLSEARAALRQQIVTTLHSKASAAVDTLEELMKGGTGIPAIVRLKAATCILDKSIGTSATTELEQKVAELQQMMEQINEYS